MQHVTHFQNFNSEDSICSIIHKPRNKYSKFCIKSSKYILKAIGRNAIYLQPLYCIDKNSTILLAFKKRNTKYL